jgi:hypothetical protein
MIFVTSLTAFGVGFGLNFGLSIFKDFLINHQASAFEHATEVYYKISKLWVYAGLILIFFTFAILEISKPIETSDSLKGEYILIYFISMILSLIFSLINYKEDQFIKRTSVITIFIISLSLLWLIIESKLNIVLKSPLTTSLLIFNTTYIFMASISKGFFNLKTKEISQTREYNYFIENKEVNFNNTSTSEINLKISENENNGIDIRINDSKS